MASALVPKVSKRGFGTFDTGDSRHILKNTNPWQLVRSLCDRFIAAHLRMEIQQNGGLKMEKMTLDEWIIFLKQKHDAYEDIKLKKKFVWHLIRCLQDVQSETNNHVLEKAELMVTLQVTSQKLDIVIEKTEELRTKVNSLFAYKP